MSTRALANNTSPLEAGAAAQVTDGPLIAPWVPLPTAPERPPETPLPPSRPGRRHHAYGLPYGRRLEPVELYPTGGRIELVRAVAEAHDGPQVPDLIDRTTDRDVPTSVVAATTLFY